VVREGGLSRCDQVLQFLESRAQPFRSHKYISRICLIFEHPQPQLQRDSDVGRRSISESWSESGEYHRRWNSSKSQVQVNDTAISIIFDDLTGLIRLIGLFKNEELLK
jgi:hypothetical protein